MAGHPRRHVGARKRVTGAYGVDDLRGRVNTQTDAALNVTVSIDGEDWLRIIRDDEFRFRPEESQCVSDLVRCLAPAEIAFIREIGKYDVRELDDGIEPVSRLLAPPRIAGRQAPTVLSIRHLPIRRPKISRDN